MLPSQHLLRSLRKVHLHLSLDEAGAPGMGDAPTTEDVARIATEKFEAGGWHVYETSGFDMDITYDGSAYLVEAWAY